MWEVKWLEVHVTSESLYGQLDESYNRNFKAQYEKIPSNN